MGKIEDLVCELSEKLRSEGPYSERNLIENILCQTGREIDKDRYYEEKKKVISPLNLTWDGNTEGLEKFDLPEQEYVSFYKVSDDLFTNEQIRKMTGKCNDGLSLDLSDPDLIHVETEDFLFSEIFVLARKDEIFFDNGSGVRLPIKLPSTGVYFVRSGERFLSSLTSTEPMEWTETIIHKIDGKFLPDDAGDKIIPCFNLADYGVSEFPASGSFIALRGDVSKFKEAAKKGLIKVILPNNVVVFPSIACSNAGDVELSIIYVESNFSIRLFYIVLSSDIRVFGVYQIADSVFG